MRINAITASAMALFPKPQHASYDGRIQGDQQPVHRISGFRSNAATDQITIKTGAKVIEKSCCKKHCESFGKGQRLEKPSFLRFERKDRQERRP